MADTTISKKRRNTKPANFLKLPVPEVLKLLGTLEKQIPSLNDLKPRKHTGCCYYYECILKLNYTNRKMLKEKDAYKRKRRKNKEIFYTQKQVQLEKGCHALPKIEVTYLKKQCISLL